MTVLYEEQMTVQFPFDPKGLAQDVIRTTLDILAFPHEAEISLTIVSEGSIQEMNRTFRNIDRPTDVLSFPLIELPSPGDFSEIDANPDNYNPDTGEVLLGDIVLSAAHVKVQAAEYGHSEKREYAFLITHSMLHLCGYDHLTPQEEAEMTAMQETILAKMDITRS